MLKKIASDIKNILSFPNFRHKNFQKMLFIVFGKLFKNVKYFKKIVNKYYTTRRSVIIKITLNALSIS